MARLINPNFLQLRRSLMAGKSGCVLEGGSRSGKTWSGVDFVIYLTARIETACTINIIKETYNSFKTTLYEDFNRRLPQFGIASPFDNVQEKPSFWLMGSKINLIGADKVASNKHGQGADYVWYNESLDIAKATFDQTEMRCRKFWWMDYNPKFTDHWIFDNVCGREDVDFLKTTFLDNPFISESEKKKILSYEDTEKNRRNGTVDTYMWEVYGLGLRAARQGLIFPEVVWIDQFPEGLDKVVYGMDFGYTIDPTAIVKAGRIENNLYLEKQLYKPIDNGAQLSTYFDAIVGKDHHCWADSSDPGMISDLRQRGFNCFGVTKFPGSIKYGIDKLKQFKIHIVRSDEFRKEQENYCWDEINGIMLNEPIDKFNHLWDASRYAVMSEFR